MTIEKESNQELELKSKKIFPFFDTSGKTINLAESPVGIFFSDLHLTKRKPPFFHGKLDLIPLSEILRKTRYYYWLARMVFSDFCQKICKDFKQENILVFGGDISDTFETEAFLENMVFLEKNLERSPQKFPVIWLTGNHDTAFVGQDQYRLKKLRKKIPDISIDEYKEIIQMIIQGHRWQEVLNYWKEKHHNQPFIIHPILRWYLIKLYFGPSIGRIINERNNAQIVFLNSELYSNSSNITHQQSESGTVNGLKRAIEQDSLFRQDQELSQKMIALIEQEEKSQKELIEQVKQSFEQGRETIIYTHDVRKIWHIIAEMAKNNPQNKITIITAHYHLGEDESLLNHPEFKKYPNVTIISTTGFSRHILFPFCQKPGGRLTRYSLRLNPYSYKPIKFIKGPLDQPCLTEFNTQNLLERINKLINLFKK